MDAGKVPVIVGPTAIGKTAVALSLSRHWPLEIISSDSRQIYRGLDVGTAKPSRRQQAAVPHHLIDVVRPGERYSAGRFARDAARFAGEIRQRGNLPVRDCRELPPPGVAGAPDARQNAGVVEVPLDGNVLFGRLCPRFSRRVGYVVDDKLNTSATFEMLDLVAPEADGHRAPIDQQPQNQAQLQKQQREQGAVQNRPADGGAAHAGIPLPPGERPLECVLVSGHGRNLPLNRRGWSASVPGVGKG